MQGMSMKRDKQLAKEILEIIATEDNSGEGLDRCGILAVLIERYPSVGAAYEAELNYHLHLLHTGGFLKATFDEDEFELDNFEMTWTGHDLLEAD